MRTLRNYVEPIAHNRGHDNLDRLTLDGPLIYHPPVPSLLETILSKVHLSRRRVGTPTRRSDPNTLFARVRPKTVSVTEKYWFHQELSSNPFIRRQDSNATGEVKALVPYDGFHYFTRDAIQDVQEQLRRLAEPDSRTDLMATIGHLNFTDIRDARRTDGRPLAVLHDAVPLRVPVRSQLLGEKLYSDKYESILQIDYTPPAVDGYPFPLKIDFTIFDPEDQPVTPDELRIRHGKRNKAGPVPEQIIRQPAFSSELWLVLRISLLWPRRTLKEPPSATIKRVALTWPTITSLAPSSLRFSLGRKASQMLYNPEKGCLEWLGIPLGAAKDDGDDESAPDESSKTGDADDPEAGDNEDATDETSGGATKKGARGADTDDADGEDDGDDALEDDDQGDDDDGSVFRMRSAEMQLIVEQPGQLRNEDTLEGEIEVEVADELYSGMAVRLFNANGKRQARETLSLKTTLSLRFEVYLDDEFNRRNVSATYTLHFDEVIPEEGRVDDIMAALRDRGFSLAPFPKEGSDDAPQWFIRASRDEGPNEILLLLVIRGRRYTTRRRAETPGWHRYTSKLDSGDIRITVYGKVPRDNRELTSEVNELRKSLTARFSHVQAQR